jgi:hypothetical protein
MTARVRTTHDGPGDPDVSPLAVRSNLVHRSIASALTGALVLPLTVLSASAAEAHHRPASKPKTSSVVLKTDAMPTRVVATTAASG